MKKILVLSGDSRISLENKGASYSQECDTLKEAKQRAKYSLTVDFQRSGEMSEPFNYARVVVYDGPSYARVETLHSEFWRVGYNEPQELLDDPEERL